MTAAVQTSRETLTVPKAILYGGLVAGALDATDGVVAYGLQGLNPIQVLQFIASGMLGKASFDGGLATAGLGTVQHFFIAFTVAAIYVLASRKMPALRTHAVPLGAIFGRAGLSGDELPRAAALSGRAQPVLASHVPERSDRPRAVRRTAHCSICKEGGVMTIVLVHAAWADASNWSKVLLRLRAAGPGVVAAQLPLSSLSDDVAALRQLIDRVEGPVVLAAHSYGGAVISAAAAGLNKVKGLVYIAAMAPDRGRNCSPASAPRRTPPPGASAHAGCKRKPLDVGRGLCRRGRTRLLGRGGRHYGRCPETDLDPMHPRADDPASVEADTFLVSSGGTRSRDSALNPKIHGGAGGRPDRGARCGSHSHHIRPADGRGRDSGGRAQLRHRLRPDHRDARTRHVTDCASVYA